MKDKKSLLFKIGAVVVLIIIAVIMCIIGRGHTLYFDNASCDYNGTHVDAVYKVDVRKDGESLCKLYAGERGTDVVIGQKYKLTVEVTQVKGGNEETLEYTLDIPYNLDNVLINVPALMKGLPQEAYFSELIIAAPVEDDDEEVVTDEFAIPEE